MDHHRKLIKHFHQPGDCHELTFSCYRRQPLLVRDDWRLMFCQAINRSMDRYQFQLVAFVLMPEHVHLLVLPPSGNTATIGQLLYAMKRPYSYRIKQILDNEHNPLLKKLTIHERPGKETFRYWQEGPGYDRNFSDHAAVLNAINYIHENPVRRGLVTRAVDWKWSSARWYVSEKHTIDLDLPPIHGLPWEFWNS